MESPKKQYGCTQIIVRIAIGVAIIFAIDYSVEFLFRYLYPPDDITHALIPFQNGYFARTDAFITSEGMVNEFNDDPSATSRFLGLVIIPIVGIILLSVVFYLIPFTNKLLNFFPHAIVVAFIILMIDSLFVPPVMTIIDRERKVITIHRPEWMLFGTKTEIPFERVTDFTYKLEEDPGLNHRDDVMYADIYAQTSDGEVFVGESQVGMHAQTTEDPVILKERQQEIDATILALKLLVGVNVHTFEPLP